ncbi:MAG: CGGC domain-containing protein [Planctomycetes bacterium GWF2_50_10]|nr:MAG: CGGC domain-containing protein [Planctomycetes bacterium GWF2_50_10]
MTRIGIIRCQQTEDLCAGTTDFKVAQEGKAAFADMGQIEIVGFVSCGGCPGKRAVTRAKNMVDRGAQAIAFASCIAKGTPLGFPCPHWQLIKSAVESKLGHEIKLIEYTH